MDSTDVDTSMNDINDADVQDHSMMDDLFGEANDSINVNVNIPLSTVTLPPPAGLIGRIADLQASGACT